MSEYLQKVIYLTQSDYNTLASGTESVPQSITKNGITLTNLNDNYLYVTDGKITDSDINGVISVSHGGTGVNSFINGQVLIGNGTDPISSIGKTSTNTSNTLVERDANGDFNARNITMTQGNIGDMTLSGTTIEAVTAINTSGNNGLLAYKPSGWTGVNSNQWGVGTINAQGVIRSSNTDLLHSRNGTNSVILDVGNYKTYAYALDGSNAGTVLKLNQDTGEDPSLTSNARIEFSYSSDHSQPVNISYTPNNSYHNHNYAGLAILGGGSGSPAWLEVEGNVYAAAFKGNADSATSAKYINLYEARGTTTTLNKAANYVAAGAMFHLVASSNTDATDNGKTPTDANILQMNWDTNGGYDSQLGISTSRNRMYFRAKPSAKTAWAEVAHAPVSATGVGNSTQPVYMTSDGVITACTSYANASVNYATSAGNATSATTATSLTNFVVSTYTIPGGKGVRIQYPGHAPVLISCQRANSNGRLILIGGGYGEQGTVRNDFTELVSPAENSFIWSMPEPTGYSRSIEIINVSTNTDATVWVEATAACTFTEITALTSTKTNRKLLHSSNYTDYAVAKTDGVTAVTWDATNKKLTRTINGTAADVMTAAQMSTALELGTIASKATTDYLPVKYSSLDYSSTTTTMGIYPINSQTHPVTGKSEYGGAIQFGNSSTSNSYYAAQLLVSSQSGRTAPVHAYIRRMTNAPEWSDWATLLDNNNYTDYTVTKTGTGASGTWGISISGKAGSVDWANTGHPATFPPTVGTTATTAMAGNTNVTTVAIAANDTSSTGTFPVTYAATNTSTTTAKNDTLKKSTGKLYFQPSTGTLTATKFSGPLTGDVTGDVSGSSSSCTGNSATASKLTDLTSSDQATNNDTWRRVWISYQNNTNGRPAYKDTIAFQTSTNTLRSGKYLVDESVILEYNSTDESLDFTFI